MACRPGYGRGEVCRSSWPPAVGWCPTSRPACVEVLETLKPHGFHLAMHDFGAVYSSLSYLKRFRPDRLKIDRAFIHDIFADADDVAITQAIIANARQWRNG